MSEAPATDTLVPPPASSRWGRRIAAVYLVVVGAAFALLFYELAAGQRGLGSIAISVLTAPWSAALAMLAQAIRGALPEVAMRALGIVLAAACALLNARILYGMAARAERDVRGGR